MGASPGEPVRGGVRGDHDGGAAGGRERAQGDLRGDLRIGRNRRMRLLAGPRLRDGPRASTPGAGCAHREGARGRARARLGTHPRRGNPAARARGRVGHRSGPADCGGRGALQRGGEPDRLRADRRDPLAREEVMRHQRIRIHGAMVEAVAANGYEGTSVKQVIALAGVSRRSFYEQFANKQECLLATFDLLAGNAVRRAGDAYLASDGPLEERLRAALAEFAHSIVENRKAAQLVILETQTAGVPGLMRLRRATATCERMLCKSFMTDPEASPLPIPVVRGIAGGLHAALSAWVREGSAIGTSQLTEEMLEWTLRFQTPAAA